MPVYHAPLADMRLLFRHVVGMEAVAALPAYHEDVTPDVVDAVLDEADKFAGGVLAPLNRPGDQHGARLDNGQVSTAPGFRAAYHQFIEGGWNGLAHPVEFGGQGLPQLLSVAVQEMWQSANMAFALCPMLNHGAAELLASHASPAQKDLYLTRMVAGTWTGTMNLTEPQAGSDLAAVRCRAVRDTTRTEEVYRISGQKIFITYGDHDYTDNIVHLVLARLPDAPPGVKGISLFIVPKTLCAADGTPGAANDVRCVGLEHKLGIHASPTAVMAFGETEGALGWRVGAENNGLACMFTMMNNARLNVGLQGVAIAERAWQRACAYAQARIQGRDLAGRQPGLVPILRHPDVRRMLLSMKSLTEAARALTYSAMAAADFAHHHPEPAVAAAAQRRVDLLTPVVKAWATEAGCRVTSLGLQVHGGMGFMEETGAAQHFRDARIAPIYEGTNGIQAMDLVFRKLGRDGGAAVRVYLDDTLAICRDSHVRAALDRLRVTTEVMVGRATQAPLAAAAAATPYLLQFGTVAAAALMEMAARGATIDQATGQASGQGDPVFAAARCQSTRFFLEQILPEAECYAAQVLAAQEAVLDEAALLATE